MKLKIFWLDDDINKLSSHIYFLEQKGNEIIQAKSIDEAISVCNKQLNQFDCAIIDLRMLYGENNRAGINFIRKLLEEYKFEKPIIAFTVLGRKNDQQLISLLKHPNIYHFQKGVTVTQLYDFLVAIFKRQ